MAEQISVFLSYRRADTPHVSGRLGDRLAERYKLFMDIDNIRPGMDFTKVVRDAINECDVLLALIGQNWLASFGDVAKRTSDSPRDWVIEEVKAALTRDITVIPVLVDGARMPDPGEVPEVLEPLTYRQALTLRHESFSADVAKLFRAIEAVAEPIAAEKVAPQQDLFKDLEYSRALAAMFNRRWEEAVVLLTSVHERFPDNSDVASRMERSTHNQRLAALDLRAAEAETAGRWRDAVEALEELKAADPGFPDIGQRLAAAGNERQIADLRDELRGLYNAAEWTGVVAASERIAELDPARADPDGLTTAARERLAAIEVEDIYAAGVRHLVAGEFAKAADAFEAVRAKQPNFRDTSDLLAAAKAQLELAAWHQRAAAAEAGLDWEAAVTHLSMIVNRDRQYENAGVRLAAAIAQRDVAHGSPGRADEPTSSAHYPPRSAVAPEARTDPPKPWAGPESMSVPRTKRAALVGLAIGLGWLLVLVIYGSSLETPHQLAHHFPGFAIPILITLLVCVVKMEVDGRRASSMARRWSRVSSILGVVAAFFLGIVLSLAVLDNQSEVVPMYWIAIFGLHTAGGAIEFLALRRRLGYGAVWPALIFFLTGMATILIAPGPMD